MFTLYSSGLLRHDTGLLSDLRASGSSRAPDYFQDAGAPQCSTAAGLCKVESSRPRSGRLRPSAAVNIAVGGGDMSSISDDDFEDEEALRLSAILCVCVCVRSHACSRIGLAHPGDR